MDNMITWRENLSRRMDRSGLESGGALLLEDLFSFRVTLTLDNDRRCEYCNVVEIGNENGKGVSFVRSGKRFAHFYCTLLRGDVSSRNFLFFLSLLLFFFPLIRPDRSNDASRVKLDNLLRVKKKGNK